MPFQRPTSVLRTSTRRHGALCSIRERIWVRRVCRFFEAHYIGYPDFYPSRPGNLQTEDLLTEENVKNGFSAKMFVAPTVSDSRR